MYKNCKDVYDAGHTTPGVYEIKPDGANETDVYCEQKLYGGGWTVSLSKSIPSYFRSMCMKFNLRW